MPKRRVKSTQQGFRVRTSSVSTGWRLSSAQKKKSPMHRSDLFWTSQRFCEIQFPLPLRWSLAIIGVCNASEKAVTWWWLAKCLYFFCLAEKQGLLLAEWSRNVIIPEVPNPFGWILWYTKSTFKTCMFGGFVSPKEMKLPSGLKRLITRQNGFR